MGFRVLRDEDSFSDVCPLSSIASAFTAIVKSLTSDIILPVISLLPFLNRNLDEKFAVLRAGHNYHHNNGTKGYNTVNQALDDGAVVMAYGSFLDKIVRFFVVGLALYTIARVYGWASKDSVIKHTVKCRYCRKSISEKVCKFEHPPPFFRWLICFYTRLAISAGMDSANLCFCICNT